MSEMGSHVGLDPPGTVSQLDWEQLMQSAGESPSLGKRYRPTSFDAVSLQLQDGGNPFFWGEQLFEGGGNEINLTRQLLGGYGERVDSFTADSADSAVCAQNYGFPPSSSDDSDPLAVYGLVDNMPTFGQQASEPLPPPSAPPPFRRQVSDPLPKTSPAVEKFARTRTRKFTSKSMTTEEIHKAYAQSWGGALKATPAGGDVSLRTPLLAKPPEKFKRAESKAANEAKAEAANIIRDLFRRPGAKRQAVPLEGGQIGSLERGISQLSAQTVPAQVRNPQICAPIRTASNNSNENVVSPAESQTASLPPTRTPKAQAVPRDVNAVSLSGRDPKTGGAVNSSNGANDLASLQREAQVLLALMGGSVGQGKPPPGRTQIVIPLERASHSQGGSKQSQECPLLRAVDVAGCQVALACPVELDTGLLLYDPWEKTGETCPSPEAPVEWRGLDRLGSFGGLGDLGSFDWLLQADIGLGSSRLLADGPPAFIGDSDPWSPGFPDLLGEAGRSVQEPGLDTLPSAGRSEPTSAPKQSTPRLPLHHLWAQLEPGQIREPRFRTYRTAYKEEIRRLRIWAATFVGEPLLPAVADLHFLSCNALPNLQDRHIRMMLTKGGLWTAFVTHSLATASPADVYFARHEGQDAYKGSNPAGLDNMTVGMQLKCKNMCFLAEDLKDESAYGPEIFRTYGALHKSLGPSRAPAGFGCACQQITFPELNDPKPTPVKSADPTSIEPIEFDKGQAAKLKGPDGASLPWGTYWVNRQRLLSTGRGLRGAGEPARVALQTLFERAIDAHVEKYDVMATGTPPTLGRYLAYARDELGTAVSLGLAFCAIGQGLADAGRWEPMLDDVEQLFEEMRKATELAGNVVRIMSDLRTYQDDLVQLRLNAVAIRMREADCSQKEALDFLIARASTDIKALGAEIKGHASKSVFARACWRLPFEVCRVAVTLFTILGSESRGNDLFEVGSSASKN